MQIHTRVCTYCTLSPFQDFSIKILGFYKYISIIKFWLFPAVPSLKNNYFWLPKLPSLTSLKICGTDKE